MPTPHKTPTKIPSDKSNISLSLLSQAHPPDRAQEIYDEKIRKRPLHLKPSSSTTNPQQARRLARQLKVSKAKKKQKPRPLSARQKRSLMLYAIPKSEQKYAIYEPLNRMWKGYIQEVLGLRPEGGLVSSAEAAKLASADFHGAEVEVVRSRCVSRVGVKGIVVKESRFSLEVITSKDEVKVLPKEGTVFRFVVPFPGKQTEEGKDEVEEGKGAETKLKDLVFELHGDQFEYRAADRANRKFKSHFLRDL